MGLKVGDKVEVRSDLELGEYYQDYGFFIDMARFMGKTVTLVEEIENGIFYILEDDGNGCWSNEMFQTTIKRLSAISEVYEKIVEWELNAGESFIDYFESDVNERTFMTWCLGRNYLSKEKYNLWVEAVHKNELEATSPNYYLYSIDGDNVPFAVVLSNGWDEESQKKAYLILSEFIIDINVYQDRFLNFLNEN